MPASSPATDSSSLVESFEPLEDPRHGEIYPLEEIVVLVICATISGADTFVAVQQFGEARLEWLRGLLPFEKGIPSHDVLSGVFGRIDPVQFEDCFRRWVQGIRRKTDGEVVAIDGKTLCGSGDRATGKEPRHLVEAWATEQRLVLGQRRSEDGSNEIEAIPHLLEELLLEGCIVTIDAMGCQTDIAEAIQEAGADYVLRVKDNQESLRTDIERVFERCREHGAEPGTTDVDGGHGRVETRRCWAMEVGGRGLIDSDRWAGARSIALIETERFEADPSVESGAEAGSVGGETTTERRYVLSSLPPDATQLLEATRRHWRVENGLHWSLDVAFGEDDSQVRSGNAADNLGRVRRLALSMLRQDDSIEGGTETKRLRAGWDSDYLEHLLRQL
ncbi:MAG: ISAs1 family transposase [Salinibacter sp.]